MPEYDCGFFRSPYTVKHRNPTWSQADNKHLTCISLFAGCGGLDLGIAGGFKVFGKIYQKRPIRIVGAFDNSSDAVEAYRLNLGDHAHRCDLEEALVEQLPRADVLMGGFPCQDFSSSGPKVGTSGKRGGLYRVLAKYMRSHKPSVVIGENVPHLARLQSGKYMKEILSAFEEEGYHFTVWNLCAPDYGLPQSRRRLFLIGVRNDLPGFPYKTTQRHYVRIPRERLIEAVVQLDQKRQAQA